MTVWVCFSVYPQGVGQALQAAFANYDQAFARALGLRVYRPEHEKDDYAIAKVLAPDWWDDGYWDPGEERGGNFKSKAAGPTGPAAEKAER